MDAVQDNLNFFAVDPALDQILFEGVRYGDDFGGAAIQKKLQPLHQAEQIRRLVQTDGGDRSRPYVAQLENKRHPLDACCRPAGHGREKLRACGHHQIGFSDEQAGKKRGDHVGQKIQNADAEAVIRRDEGFDAADLNAVHFFAAEPFVLVAVIDLAFREVRRAGDDRHRMALLDPDFGMLIGARRRCVGFWREIVGEKQNMHGSPSHCRDKPVIVQADTQARRLAPQIEPRMIA